MTQLHRTGGFLTMFEGQPTRPNGSEVKRAMPVDPRPARQIAVLHGYASVFHRIHDGRGAQLEAFAPGCFARSLQDGRAIRFLVGHNEAKCLATTADRLELLSDGHGLAFRVRLVEAPFVSEAIDMAKSDAGGMSVGYTVKAEEMIEIDGHKIRMLRDVELWEVSIVPSRRGAVREAFVIHAKDVSRSLADLSSSGDLAREAASVSFRRAFETASENLSKLVAR